MMPLQTIAVGFDGSRDAEAAAAWSMDLALQCDASVVLVYAVGLLARIEGEIVTADFQETVERLARQVGLDRTRIHWHVADGDACSVLARCADEPVHADLLVVGSRGQGGHAGLLLGSTSLQLAEHTTLPVVIVPSARL